jgi:hypothetical protein
MMVSSITTGNKHIGDPRQSQLVVQSVEKLDLAFLTLAECSTACRYSLRKDLANVSVTVEERPFRAA